MSMAATYKKLQVNQFSTDFRKVTEIVSVPLPSPSPTQVLVKNYYLGINASEINWTAGRYPPKPRLPFGAGFEAVGTVVAKGEKVTTLNVGDSVAVSMFGAFAEYVAVEQKSVYPIPDLDPKYITLPVSGITAAIALEQSGRLTSGEKVLVTAAAGGTGLYAVQLAKLAGNHVIATVGSDDKVAILKKLGVDRVINYKKENLDEVLRKEYPAGIDIIYESVGGDTFQTCLNNVAVGGRLIVIGMVSGYQSGAAFKGNASSVSIPAKLLSKSASVVGFYMPHYAKHIERHYRRLTDLIKTGKLQAIVDPASFKGLDRVADAIDYLYEGKNIGKIVVEIATPPPPRSKL